MRKNVILSRLRDREVDLWGFCVDSNAGDEGELRGSHGSIARNVYSVNMNNVLVLSNDV